MSIVIRQVYPVKTKAATVNRIKAIDKGLQIKARLHVRSRKHAGRHNVAKSFRTYSDAECFCAHKYIHSLSYLE